MNKDDAGTPGTPVQPPSEPGPPLPPIPDPKFKPIKNLQSAVTVYLDAELDHSAGAYLRANQQLEHLDRELACLPTARSGAIHGSLTALTASSIALNHALRKFRHSVGGTYRHLPESPRPVIERSEAVFLCSFYDVAARALEDDRDDELLGVVRRAILLDLESREPAMNQPERLRQRYLHRLDIAEHELAQADRAMVELLPRDNDPAPYALGSLEHDGGRLAACVMRALAQADIRVHEVERRRSLALGELLKRSQHEIDRDRRLLGRTVVLATATFAICQALPWVFAADGAEREQIQADPETARRAVRPGGALWPARQVIMLSLYRRAHAFRLLGDHERAYADQRKLQRISRFTEAELEKDDPRIAYLTVLDALADYRVGELFRFDHDYMQALEHTCRSHHRLPPKRFAQLEVNICLAKGKCFFETGAVKRAMKWFVRAWIALRLLRVHDDDRSSAAGAVQRPGLGEWVDELERYLERHKHDPEVDKGGLNALVEPAVGEIVACEIPDRLRALAAEVLGRMGHWLLMTRIGHESARRLLLRAETLDPRSLFVQTAISRLELSEMSPPAAGVAPIRPAEDAVGPPDALDCWPPGQDDVDKAIRAGEHLILRGLIAAKRRAISGRERDDPDEDIARDLTAHFIAHTDSINLRLEMLHRYLMRRRVERQRPELAESLPTSPYLEFVCLRRYGCFTPLLPRPAAVSAAGGGYLVRVCQPSTKPEVRRQDNFNVLIDPGEGVVTNLYRVGLGIGDIDLVIATHDHPDHLAALDAILALREERRRLSIGSALGGEDVREVTILGNDSVVKRYSHLDRIYRIGEPEGIADLPARLTIEPLPAVHTDLGGHDAVGFLLSFAPQPSSRAHRIAFMSDTSLRAVHAGASTRATTVDVSDSLWRTALSSDVVVAHVSDVSTGELCDLARLPADEPGVMEFDESVARLRDGERRDDAIRLMWAFSLVRPGEVLPRGLLEPGYLDTIEDDKHLLLHGLLAIAKAMLEPEQGDDKPLSRVLVVGELREQLGSFRHKIAGQLNVHLLDAGGRVKALTADVGLRIRIDDAHDSRVLCTTCSLNNDRLDDERFHQPQGMFEVCVKGDHEANYWLCRNHEPAAPTRPAVFIEHMGGYDPFEAGSRYPG